MVSAQEVIRLREELAGTLSALQDTARSIAEAQQEAGLAMDAEEYVESFAPFLMDVIHAWSRVRAPRMVSNGLVDLVDSSTWWGINTIVPRQI